MYSYNPYYERYLAHYGVLGMKWGVRRYQNKDGSLTPKGKERQKKLQKKLDAAMANGSDNAMFFNKDQKKIFKKINKSSSGTFATLMQYDDILQKYKHTVITKDEKNKIESKIKKQNDEYKEKLLKELKNNGFSIDGSYSTEYSTTYSKKLPKNCILEIDIDKKNGPYDSIHQRSTSPGDMANNVIKTAKNVEKNFSSINKTAAEYAMKGYSSLSKEWLSDTRFESMNEKQLSKYLEKQGPNSISIDHDGNGGTIWYQDGKKNDMDFFGDHSFTVEFGVDKNGKIKYSYTSMEG